MRDIGFLQAVHEKTWESFCKEFKKVFKLTKKEEQSLAQNTTAHFLYRLPFIAGCINPERTALAHLILYITEAFLLNKTPHLLSVTNHTPADDSYIFSRVRPLMNFSGAWNFAEKKKELLSIINDNFCTEVDDELSVEKAMGLGWTDNVFVE